ncbi:hypothetical protein GCM10011583_28240 [Streptomyces camponoticapitis]|uniref:Uncharacterized protein n=1 Tax=Streptomyces camponoticapitis TaxID=1616125 RepID=A0ABQ2E7S2_9ACTN|nr:hypothetical protein [Streptomyces camponoticapitis]GGJ95068.1 hypothetical protein GCM10011583_28240 [Streptomyces camponoticapitis]
MNKKPPAASCVESGAPAPRRLYSPEAVVIIVIVVMAAVLVAFAGLPVLDVLQLLGGAGLVAVIVVALGRAAPARGLRIAVRALLTPGPTV